jgi:hypothetical protein
MPTKCDVSSIRGRVLSERRQDGEDRLSIRGRVLSERRQDGEETHGPSCSPSARMPRRRSPQGRAPLERISSLLRRWQRGETVCVCVCLAFAIGRWLSDSGVLQPRSLASTRLPHVGHQAISCVHAMTKIPMHASHATLYQPPCCAIASLNLSNDHTTGAWLMALGERAPCQHHPPQLPCDRHVSIHACMHSCCVWPDDSHAIPSHRGACKSTSAHATFASSAGRYR